MSGSRVPESSGADSFAQILGDSFRKFRPHLLDAVLTSRSLSLSFPSQGTFPSLPLLDPTVLIRPSQSQYTVFVRRSLVREDLTDSSPSQNMAYNQIGFAKARY